MPKSEPKLALNKPPPLPPSRHPLQLVRSMGVAIYQALDWGLDDSEEQELSPQLESLLERMACGDGEADSLAGGGDGGGADHDGCVNGTADEGYSGQEDEEQEEEEEEEEEEGVDEGVLRRRRRPVYTLAKVKALCASRLANPAQAVEHYPAVCRALFVETLELQTFLTKIQDAKEVGCSLCCSCCLCLQRLRGRLLSRKVWLA